MKNQRVQSAPWFRSDGPPGRMRIFSFPYAGGSSMIFRDWGNHIPEDFEIWPAELPGRGSRSSEQPLTSMSDLVAGLAAAISEQLDRPFAFFGHSMGAIIGYELAHELLARFGRSPNYLFVSGRAAPHLPDKRPPMHNLPEAELIEELKRLGGTPKEVLDDPELVQFFLPTLRADCKLVEMWRYVPREPLPCPISAMGGVADNSVSRGDVSAWREHSSAKFSLHMFAGNHFFLDQHRKEVIQTIIGELKPGQI